GRHALDPDDPLRGLVVLDDPVDEEDRPAMRDERLDLAGRVDRLVLRRRGGVGHMGLRAVSGRLSVARSGGLALPARCRYARTQGARSARVTTARRRPGTPRTRPDR